jgi:hypothetical protein
VRASVAAGLAAGLTLFAAESAIALLATSSYVGIVLALPVGLFIAPLAAGVAGGLTGRRATTAPASVAGALVGGAAALGAIDWGEVVPMAAIIAAVVLSGHLAAVAVRTAWLPA